MMESNQLRTRHSPRLLAMSWTAGWTSTAMVTRTSSLDDVNDGLLTLTKRGAVSRSVHRVPDVRFEVIARNPPPLEGIRVVDFSRIIAGPLCTQQLADLGADVIKIEHPVTGDELRARSPRGDRRGAAFLAFNRSKRSVAIDLDTAAVVSSWRAA